MNVRIAKEEMALMMPSSLSRFAPGGEHDAIDNGTTLFARVGAALRWLSDLPRRRAVIDELSMLSDRELADIGLARDSLADVFNAEFAAARELDTRRTRSVRGYAA